MIQWGFLKIYVRILELHRCSSQGDPFDMCLKEHWMNCTGAVPKSGHIFLKAPIGSLDRVHRCSSQRYPFDMCSEEHWMNCTGAVPKFGHIFSKTPIGSLDRVHRCSSKVRTYIFKNPHWIIG